MARDLHAVGPERPPFEATLDLGEDDRVPDAGPALDQQLRAVRREQRQAGIAVMLLDAAKVVKPVLDMLSDRSLYWAAFLALVGLTAYEIRYPSWERLATVATFALLAPYLIRMGRR
jgi:hypothetical protein